MQVRVMIPRTVNSLLSLVLVWSLLTASPVPVRGQQPGPKPSDLVGVWLPDQPDPRAQKELGVSEALRKYWIQKIEISQSGNKLTIRATTVSGAVKVFEGEVQPGSPSGLGGRFVCVSGCAVKEELHGGYSEHLSNRTNADLGPGIQMMHWADAEIPGWSFRATEGFFVGVYLWRRAAPGVAKRDDDEIGPLRIVMAHDKFFGDEISTSAPKSEKVDTVVVEDPIRLVMENPTTPSPVAAATAAPIHLGELLPPETKGRILLLYGNDLPTGRANTKIEKCEYHPDLVGGTECDPNIEYTLLELASEMKKDRMTGEPTDPVWEAAWQKVEKSLPPDRKESFKKTNQMLVRADFKGGVRGGLKDGFKKFILNGAAHTWFLSRGNTRAEIHFVRLTGTRSSQGAEVFEEVDEFHVPERLYVEVRTTPDVGLKEVPLNILHNGGKLLVKSPITKDQSAKGTNEPEFVPMTMPAQRVSSNLYRTGAIDVVLPDTTQPLNGAALQLPIALGSPDKLAAVPDEEGTFLAEPLAVATARNADTPETVWIQALRKAAHSYPCLDSTCRRIPLGKAISRALAAEFERREEEDFKLREDLSNNKITTESKPLTDKERAEMVNEIAPDVIKEKLDAGRSVADVRLGHLAAMLLLKQTFIEMMEAYQASLPKIEGEAMLRRFREQVAAEIWLRKNASPFSNVPVWDGRVKSKVPGGETYNTIPLRQALFGAGSTLDNYREWVPSNQLERKEEELRIREGREKSAEQLRRDQFRETYTLEIVGEALKEYRKAVDQALTNAKAIKDDDLDKLLALTGVGFDAVVKQLKPRLVKFDKGEGRWVTDDVARRWVDEVAAVADQFEARDKIDDAGRQIFLLAIGLIPVIPATGLLGRLAAAAVFAGDVALNTIPEYIRQDEEFKFALGASGVLGTERLDAAQLQKMPDWALFVAVAGAGLGIVADLPEVLRAAQAARAAGREAAVIRNVLLELEGKGFAEFQELAKEDQVVFLASSAKAKLKVLKGEVGLTQRESEQLKLLEKLEEGAKTATTNLEAATATHTIPADKVATIEDAKNTAQKLEAAKNSAKDKNLIKDLELRINVLDELKANAARLAEFSKDDVAFLLNPTRELIAKQEGEVLNLLLNKWHDWHGLKEAYNSVPPKVSKLEMYKVVTYRTQTADDLLEGVMKDISAQTGVKLERKALGSVTLTSDYDISVEGLGSEKVVAEFNRRFRADPRFKGLESGTVFDTNIYTDPVYKIFKGKLADGTSLKLEPVQLDDLKQQMYSLMADRKYAGSAAEWNEYTARLLEGAPSDEARNVLEYAMRSAEEAHMRARDLIAERLLGKPIFGKDNIRLVSVEEVDRVIKTAEPNALVRATNDAYGEVVLSDIDKLRVESKRLDKLGTFKPSFSQPGLPSPDKEILKLLGGGDYLSDLRRIDELSQNLTPEALKEIEKIKVQLRELLAKQLRSKQGIALYFASEAYQTEGAIAHVVGELQEAGWAKKITKDSLLAGPIDRGRGVTTGQYLNSFSENRANMVKELDHALDPATGKFLDDRYAAAKAAKYFVRQLDAINQAGIPLKEDLVGEKIIDLTIGIANDKDKLEVVAKLLRDKGMTAEGFVNQVKEASNKMAVKALSKSPVNAKAKEISNYLKLMGQ